MRLSTDGQSDQYDAAAPQRSQPDPGHRLHHADRPGVGGARRRPPPDEHALTSAATALYPTSPEQGGHGRRPVGAVQRVRVEFWLLVRRPQLQNRVPVPGPVRGRAPVRAVAAVRVAGRSSSGPASADQIAADQAAVDAANAQLAAAQQNLAAATLVSPIAGTVADVTITAGQSASANSTTAHVVVIGPGQNEVTTAVTDSQVGPRSSRATGRPGHPGRRDQAHRGQGHRDRRAGHHDVGWLRQLPGDDLAGPDHERSRCSTAPHGVGGGHAGHGAGGGHGAHLGRADVRWLQRRCPRWSTATVADHHEGHARRGRARPSRRSPQV